jgi:hypothetical protein
VRLRAVPRGYQVLGQRRAVPGGRRRLVVLPALQIEVPGRVAGTRPGQPSERATGAPRRGGEPTGGVVHVVGAAAVVW